MGKSIGQINRDLRRKVQSAARHAAAEIMNGLAESGPNWSGEFANSWIVDAPGVGKGKNGSYPYTIRDTPALPDTIKAATRARKLVISNTADHAMIALDLEEGTGFVKPGSPKGDIVLEGRRVGRMRTDIVSSDKEPTSFATAPDDWFITYLKGGAMQTALANGVKIGFASENK